MGAVRGTTPDYILTLADYDLSGKTVYVTIAQRGKRMTFTGDRLRISSGESGSTIAFSLTQAETLSLKVGDAEVQAKCIDRSGEVDASGTGELTISRALLEEVIKYADDTD